MTSALQTFRILAVAATALLYATSAAPQAVAHPQSHDGGPTAPTIRQQGAIGAPSVMAQIAALDRRIQLLATDMRMLSGKMKLDAMTALLSSMLERQALMENEMKTKHEAMVRGMTEQRAQLSASFEQEPGGMCAPAN